MANEPDAVFGRLESTAASAVLASGQLWRGNGPNWGRPPGSSGGSVADRLEDAFARRLNLPYVHAVNSGTSANEAAIASLGLQPGDEVICPAVGPIFVSMAVIALGCIPVFADVDQETLLLDPNCVEQAISDKTRAIVAVHLWGTPAPMRQILEIARRAGLSVVEDCAQAFGTFIGTSRVGTFGDACCFSLQQSKHISSGEGGLVALKSPEAYARAVLYSNSGIPSFRFGVPVPKDSLGAGIRGHMGFGHNHRISELQAAIALAQLSRIDEFIARRAENVSLIDTWVREKRSPSVRVPPTFPGCSISYWKYPLSVRPGGGTYTEIAYREPVFREMNKNRFTPLGVSIGEHVRYDLGSCPRAEAGASRIRPVSVHHALTADQLHDLLEEVEEFRKLRSRHHE